MADTITALTLEADYAVRNEGSLFLVVPLNDECREWLETHTDGMWFGNALAVEPRYVGYLMEGMSEHGLLCAVDEGVN